MTQYLYSDGTENPETIKKIISRFISIFFRIGTIYLLWMMLAAMIIGFPLYLLDSSFDYWAPALLAVYGLMAVIYILYIFIKRSLPMLKLTDTKMITYKGIVFRDRVLIDEISKIETEMNNDNGIQLVIYLKNKEHFTAEIPLNDCTDGAFAGFMQKYVPEIEVVTQHRLINKQVKKPKLALVETDNNIEEPEIDEVDRLYKKLELASKSDNNELMFRTTKQLYSHGENVQALLGQLYLEGLGTDENAELAYKYFKEGKSRGCDGCTTSIGMMYYCGEYLEKSYSKAYKYLKQGISDRSGVAKYFLGLCYLYGHGVEENLKKAKLQFLKAVALDCNEGYEGLARHAGKEKNICKSFRLASKYIKGKEGPGELEMHNIFTKIK